MNNIQKGQIVFFKYKIVFCYIFLTLTGFLSNFDYKVSILEGKTNFLNFVQPFSHDGHLVFNIYAFLIQIIFNVEHDLSILTK